MNAPSLSIPPTGPQRPDAPGLFAAVAALLLAFLALVVLGAVGCASAPSRRSDKAAPRVLVVGERVRPLSPGETVVVPEPVPPARQWYLVDDEGLWQWLGIVAPNRVFITNDDQRVSQRRRAAQ